MYVTNWDSWNGPSRLYNLLQRGCRTLIGQYRTFSCHIGLKVAIALHPKVHYEYFMLCPCISGISQLDYHFLCLLPTGYSTLKDFWSNLFSLNEPLLWVSCRTTRTREVCTKLTPHSNTHGWLRTARNWELAIAVPRNWTYKTMFGYTMKRCEMMSIMPRN
jgi:hypothetical protein